ncbi:MAG: methylated-DNA--[protein]-cysteine S-methyltransferase [Oscillospiraceae bacterium]
MELILFETPVGVLGLGAERDAIVRLYLPHMPLPRIACHETPLLLEGKGQLLDYFEGKRRAFDLPLRFEGATPFQNRVWQALLTIPYGETCTYGQLAAQVGCPKGAQAVGQANKRNPLPILIPCHRVVAAGKLGGYNGGPELKQALLRLEQR